MQKETHFRQGLRLENLQKPAPGFQAMNGDRQVSLRCNPDLPSEHLLLRCEIRLTHPSIQPNFTDGGRVPVEQALQTATPMSGPVRCMPWMNPETWNDRCVALCKGHHPIPIGFAGSVDHHLLDADPPTILQDPVPLSIEPGILKMIVRVKQWQTPESVWKMRVGKLSNRAFELAEAVSSIGGEVLIDPDLFQKGCVSTEDFFRGAPTVEFTNQAGDSPNNRGIGVGSEIAESFTGIGNHPKAGQATLDAEFIHPILAFQRRTGAAPGDDVGEAMLWIANRSQLGEEGIFFSLERHDWLVGASCPRSNPYWQYSVCHDLERLSAVSIRVGQERSDPV
jgi:hypothetical protein